MNIKQYNNVDEPFRLPHGHNLFTWSIPFLTDKLGEMMDNILHR